MIERQTNWLGECRVDVPLLRALESSVAGDFDVLAGSILSGRQQLVVSGFKLANIATGSPATSIQLLVGGSSLMNFYASESGSMFQVPAGRAPELLNSTNPLVSGSWTANTTNFVGLDLLRSADATTSDTLQFLNASTLVEVPKNVPLGRTLNYRIVISTTSFSSQLNLVPISKVVLDASGNIASVQDCRNILGRVAPGGDFANPNQGYLWPYGRAELLTGDVFSGGDKGISSIRETIQAIETRIWEVGGGTYWYSPTADRNVHMDRLPGAVFTSTTADNFEWIGGANLHWQGLRFVFDNSNVGGIYYNTVVDQLASSAGLTDLTPGQCIYVDLVRSSAATIQPLKGTIQTLGQSLTPGQRWIIAWCNPDGSISTRDMPWPVNTAFAPATTVAIGAVRLAYADAGAGTPTVPNLDANNAVTIGVAAYPVTGAHTALTVLSAGSGAGITLATGTGVGCTISVNGGTPAAGAFGLSVAVIGAVGIYSLSDTFNAIYGRTTGSILPSILGENVFGGGVGVRGNTDSGTGVFGNASSTGIGVHGKTVAAGNDAVWGENTSTGVGVYGSTVGGFGVSGYDSGSGIGVRAESASGTGVSGLGAVSGGTFNNQVASAPGALKNSIKSTTGNLSLNGVANPNTSDSVKNTLTPKNIVKSWGTFSGLPAVGGVITPIEACGVASIVQNIGAPGNGHIVVTLTDSFVTATGWALSLQILTPFYTNTGPSVAALIQLIGQTANTFEFIVSLYGGSGGVAIPNINGTLFSFIAIGPQ